jgi:hypothetical protein
MAKKAPNTSVNRSLKTNPIDAERTMATPHFDASAVRQARPAVPLAEIRAKRAWPLTLIALAVLAGLAGGVLGGILSTGYLRRDGVQPAAQEVSTNAVASATEAAATDEAAVDEPASSQPATVEANQTNQAPPSPVLKAAVTSESRKPESDERAQRSKEEISREAVPGEKHRELRAALNEWVAATNARNLGKQLSFYRPTMNAFYRRRNVSVAEVGADRARVFERANSINIQAEAPNIELAPDGRTATMLFRKHYSIAGGGEDRNGEVVQELRWQRVQGKWRIISERDVRVVR